MPPISKRVGFFPLKTWEGEHKSYKQEVEGYYSFRVDSPINDQARLDSYNAATADLQGLIATAIDRGKTLRALGSSWSLSKVGMTNHHLITTKALTNAFHFAQDQVDPSYPDAAALRFVECGNSMADLNRYLFSDGLSLKASGSNNGQTLVGAVSTGTHGSAFRFGACPDFVVGIHLITGSSKHVYLERASRPVVAPSIAQKLGAELIRDDTLFNSALVSFGSFGIIHGLMVETRKLFVLDVHRSWEKFDRGLKTAISSFDFSGMQLPGGEAKLYHFEVFFNPNEGTPPKEACVILMFENDWSPDYVPPRWEGGSAGLGAGALEVMGELVGAIPSPLNELVKPLLNSQVRDKFAPDKKKAIIRDLFRGEKTRGKTLSAGMGVPMNRSLDAIAVAFEAYEKFGSVLPLLISTRFVRATQAVLGFTRFDPTCVLEIDAVNTGKIRSFLEKVWEGLEKARIPFTLHWGKFNFYLTKTSVKGMYGTALDTWKASRETLFEDAEAAKVFSNSFTRSLGLTT